MKKFIFIIARTPSQFRNPIREKLFDISIESLKKQVSNQWQALIIDEVEKEDENFIYLKSTAVKKGDKIDAALEYLENQEAKPEYVIRFDDDDIISPIALKRIENEQFDCYADKYHAFIDIVTGAISLQKRFWFANTVIHRYDHAKTYLKKEDSRLLNTDHSRVWHKYYKDKTVKYTRKKHPLYLRVLSPFSVTSGSHNYNPTDEDTILKEYDKYLQDFGKWKYNTLNEFASYCSKINDLKFFED